MKSLKNYKNRNYYRTLKRHKGGNIESDNEKTVHNDNPIDSTLNKEQLPINESEQNQSTNTNESELSMIESEAF